jgi:NAD(P)-dependent dehydrogenase (short-subunit alcohol dehydrogenase family)
MEKKSAAVIVTGAAGGLGRIVVALLRVRGANVVCVDRDAATLDQVVNEPSEGSGKAVAVVADLGSAADTQKMVDAAVKNWGRIDGLFLGAAINGDAGLIHTTPDDVFDHVIRTNLKSVWLALRHAIPVMVEGGGGAIVTIGSVAALRGAPTLGAYAASKHGVVGLTQTVALEYAKQGIRANVLCPGSMDTQLIQPMLKLRGGGDSAKGLAATVAGIPNGRLARPDELASTGVWLLLDAPAHLSGQAIVIDGARTAA